MQTGIYSAQIRCAARPQNVAARTLFDEFNLTGIDLHLSRSLLGRLDKALFDARGRGRYGTAAEFEGDNAVGVFIFERGAARWNRPDGDGRSAIARLNGDELLAVDQIRHGCRHDVAAGLDGLQYLAGVGGVDPQFPAAAALEHKIPRRGHHAAVVTANAAGSLLFPDAPLCHRIPGAQQFTHRFYLARRLDGLHLRQRTVQPLQILSAVSVVRNNSINGKESVDVSNRAAVVQEVNPHRGNVEYWNVDEPGLPAVGHGVPGVPASPGRVDVFR